MNINNLIPLNQIDKDKVRKLFNENSNFAWNVQHWVASGEADFVEELLCAFGDAKVSYEFGIYSKTRFSVAETPESARDFALGLSKIQENYCFFTKEQDNAVFLFQMMWMEYANNTDPTKDDALLDRVYSGMKTICSAIRENIEKQFQYWESDENIVNERLDDFVACYGDSIWLDPSDDSLKEIKNITTWEF